MSGGSGVGADDDAEIAIDDVGVVVDVVVVVVVVRPQPSHAAVEAANAIADARKRTKRRIYPREKRPVSSMSASGKISPVTSSAASSCRA